MLLFFWASWCPYSRAAVPSMKALAERYAGREDFLVVGISLDRERAALSSFERQASLPWQDLYEQGKGFSGKIPRAYHISSIPSRWVIDKESRVRGIDLDQSSTEEMISLLLGAKDGRQPLPRALPAPAPPPVAGTCTGG